MDLKKIIVCTAALILLSALPVFSQGAIKVIANNSTIEAGQSLGAALLLNGSGSYDVYAAIGGGVFGNTLHMFSQGGVFTPLAGTMPKLKSNINIGSLSTKEKIISLLPKMSLPDTSALKGTYTFYAALCTPGSLDFTEFDAFHFEIK